MLAVTAELATDLKGDRFQEYLLEEPLQGPRRGRVHPHEGDVAPLHAGGCRMMSNACW